MALQEVFMDFDENDNAVITVKGVPGKACKTLTQDLERKLGSVIDVKETAEMRQAEVKNVKRATAKS